MRKKKLENKFDDNLDNSLSNKDDVKNFTKSINDICKTINKNLSSKGGGAYMMNDPNSPTNVKFFVSSGSVILDTIIANKENGGFPVPKIVEIFGTPSSGKSLIAAHTLAETQKMGGLAIYIDTEAAVTPDFLQIIGVDIDKLMWIQIPTVEDVFATIEAIVTEAKETINPPFITIVWDSIAANSDEKEMEGDYQAEGYGMQKAKMLSKGFRKITNFIANNNVLLLCTNQIRDNLGAGYGAPQYATPGGWALAFYSSLRLEVKRKSWIKMKIPMGDKEIEETVGIEVRVKVDKSRIAPPKRECILKIYFSKGIDDKDSWFEALISYGIIERPTAQTYLLKLDDGREFKFKKTDWKNIVTENNLLPILKDLVVNAHIVKYSKFDDTNWGEDAVVPEKYKDKEIEITNNSESLDETGIEFSESE